MPRTADREGKREDIAEATWRVIEREGHTGANVREIAREAGYSTGVLSHYFRDKQELVAFSFGLLVDRSTERTARSAAEAGLEQALSELLPLDEERCREAKLWLVLMGASVADAALAEELRRRYRQAREAMWSVFWDTLGLTRQQLSEDLLDEVLVVVDGVAVEALTDPDRYPPERQMALLRQALGRMGIPTSSSRLRDH